MTRQAEYLERAQAKLTRAEYAAALAEGRRVAKASRRTREPVETPTFLDRSVPSLIAAAGRRVADADPEDLARLVALHDDLDKAVTIAVDGLREQGHSWAVIGRAVGTTKQAAFQRWG